MFGKPSVQHHLEQYKLCYIRHHRSARPRLNTLLQMALSVPQCLKPAATLVKSDVSYPHYLRQEYPQNAFRPESLSYVDLTSISVPAFTQCREYHLLQYAACSCITRRHIPQTPLVPKTSFAEDRSPVQLIIRGASRNLSEKPNSLYRCTTRGVA